MAKHPGSLSIFLLLFFLILIEISPALGAISSQPGIHEHFEKGIRSCRKGDFDEGIRYFNSILQMEPSHYLAYLNRGIAYKDKNAYDQAIVDFNHCIQLDPGNAEAYFQLGVVYGNQANLEEAILQYSKAVIVKPSHTKAFAARAMMHSLNGSLNSAIDDINQAISTDPEFPMFYIVRGQFLDEQGDCRAAISDFEKAMEADSEIFNTKGNLAWVLATAPGKDCRDGEKALKLAKEELSSGESHEKLKILAAAYAEVLDFKHAVEFQEKALEKLKQVKPLHPLDARILGEDLKKYLNQLKSYQNRRPWRQRP
ncbi:MAG: tetratricopeptide repeat protein [Proteobacteria bacterium]|nr:tetratricopeptide repeat protein [Pseudomonadota bacterium]MBU4469580.1 tetratricopeptide repeat protein [Pseudomonadota bacterium]MCG2753258.1 tetratricopeptide repeat protein [Desulfobacteraceae bacterium]